MVKSKAKRKPMPEANVWFENLPRAAHVEDRGTHYVYVGADGKEAVVCWSTHTHPNAQKSLDRLVRETWKRKAMADLKKPVD